MEFKADHNIPVLGEASKSTAYDNAQDVKTHTNQLFLTRTIIVEGENATGNQKEARLIYVSVGLENIVCPLALPVNVAAANANVGRYH